MDGAFFRGRGKKIVKNFGELSEDLHWQNPFVERVIGSLRRECLDHVIVVNENHLRRILKSYCQYYHRTRTHLALSKDAPEPRAKQPPDLALR